MASLLSPQLKRLLGYVRPYSVRLVAGVILLAFVGLAEGLTALMVKPAVLKEIRAAAFKCGKLVDLYSGVGVIGLTLRDLADKVLAVESSDSSAKYAAINALRNHADNYETTCSMSEKAKDKLFEGTDILVLDPPRAGLHNKVIKRIMAILPKRIIYLSCNPITQGRDAAFFLEKYKIIRSAGFDFYPNTPHSETLLVFERS